MLAFKRWHQLVSNNGSEKEIPWIAALLNSTMIKKALASSHQTMAAKMFLFMQLPLSARVFTAWPKANKYYLTLTQTAAVVKWQ